ncbi:MAG TPA: undecaprenyldiphospho-muramoylpentapeptide beta-N-acetylglucosaminyltransferase [Pyrinomonadaceae bacterium]|nr:undecaprenyldiphospho-muramoylpentapeptide beta-N-acetylglucosaminyltransferase [Pyrinomonadaceae bacterium]
MRVLIAAGGTGGHIYPGIAVAQEIMRRDAGSKVRFVGTARGLETRLVRQAGFELSLIDSAGLKNVGRIAQMRGLVLLPKSFLSALGLIRQFRPDVVVGAGGYVSGPVVLMAAMTNRRTLVMESNALPGWTNRVLARFVDRAAVSFEQALPFFRGKGTVTGNPVRREFFEIPPKQREPGRFSLLIFGGSQGARAINDGMIAALPALKSLKSTLRIKHQTGPADLDKVKTAYAKAGWDEQVDVRSYIDNMMDDFAAADLVICRAGATTTAELIAAGKASIMVPFPFAADDHQRKNAEALEAAGASRMILQQDLSGERLAGEIEKLVSAPQTLDQMEEASRKLAHGDAAVSVVNMIEELSHKKSQKAQKSPEAQEAQKAQKEQSTKH